MCISYMIEQEKKNGGKKMVEYKVCYDGHTLAYTVEGISILQKW